MSGQSGDTPPGWYPLPQGGQGYWDGQHWQSLPDPTGTGSIPAANVAKSSTSVATVVAFCVLVAAAVGALLWKNNQDTEMRNAAIAASSSKASADAKAAAEARAVADAKAAAAAEADRVRRAAEAKQAERVQAIKEMEYTIKDFAEKQGREGLFDGPVLSVSCDPVGGGKTDDLTAQATIFECFAAVTDNGDGTLSGKKYHATMNWDTGNYTYGLGPP